MAGFWTIAGLTLDALGAAAAESNRQKKTRKRQDLAAALRSKPEFKPMNRDQFERFMRDIRAEWRDEDKLDVCKVITKSRRGLSGGQLEKVLRAMTSDSKKVEVVRMLADRITDPEKCDFNAVMLYSSNRREVRNLLYG